MKPYLSCFHVSPFPVKNLKKKQIRADLRECTQHFDLPVYLHIRTIKTPLLISCLVFQTDQRGKGCHYDFYWQLQTMMLWATPAGADCSHYESPQLPSDMPPSAPFSSVCGQQSGCAKYCCELGSFHIVLTQPIAVIARKIKHKHIQKESTFPLPLITSLRPQLGSLLLETIQPLTTQAEAWQAIPGMSDE